MHLRKALSGSVTSASSSPASGFGTSMRGMRGTSTQARSPTSARLLTEGSPPFNRCERCDGVASARAAASSRADGWLRGSDDLERACFSPPLEPMCPLIGVYECPPGCVYQSMRDAFWLLILLAGPGGAQWRHFGEGQPTIAPYSLARDMLAAHNAVRARVGTAPLAWSDPLAARSQDWADTLQARGQFAHRPNSPYGENLFEIAGAAASPAQVVEAWAGESRNYDYSSNRCRGMCGHYTQIAWRDTKEVGCAVARGRGRDVWVCDYDPPGNWVGRRPY